MDSGMEEEVEVGDGGGEKKGKVKVKGGRVTERDVEIVRWLGRHRLATAEQVMARFGMHRTKAYDRLRLLVSEGMVRFEDGLRTKRVYLATPRGQRFAGLDLPRATIAPSTFLHDLTVVDVAIKFELATARRVLSERELRRFGAGPDNPFRLRVPCVDPQSSKGAWPDLVIEDLGTGNLFAIEVELTLKNKRRLLDKVGAYIGSKYVKVIYLTSQVAVRSSVRAIATELQIGDRLVAEAISTLGTDIKPAEDTILQLRADVDRLRSEHAQETRKAVEHAAALDVRQRMLVSELRGFVDGGRGERREILERWQRELPNQ